MKDILQEIAEKTKNRVAAQKKELSLEAVKAQAFQMLEEEKAAGLPAFPFFQALSTPGIHLICEAKKASPSKGLIAEHFPYVEIAKDYEAGGASAISVLTEPFYFLGSNAYLQEIKAAVSIPVLRKDFIVEPYQIYETKTLHADACLLICAILTEAELKEYLRLAHELGLSALVETHNAEEIQMALGAGAKIIGVNNRNLKDFSVDIGHSAALRKQVPSDVVFVAESGIHTKEQVAELKADGVNGVLIGETFMRAENRRAMVADYAKI